MVGFDNTNNSHKKNNNNKNNTTLNTSYSSTNNDNNNDNTNINSSNNNNVVLFEPFDGTDDGFELDNNNDARFFNSNSIFRKQHIDEIDESLHQGPVDLDELFENYRINNIHDDNGSLIFDGDTDNGSLLLLRQNSNNKKSKRKKKRHHRHHHNNNNNSFDNSDNNEDDDDDDPWYYNQEYYNNNNYNNKRLYYSNPNKRLLDNDASLIPGSPFSKPSIRLSNRPVEPLHIARYASSISFILTFCIIIFLLFASIYNYTDNIGRIIVELILSILSFFGIFWNIYFIIASICKCFIPAKAFKTNTKYCSIIPEQPPPPFIPQQQQKQQQFVINNDNINLTNTIQQHIENIQQQQRQNVTNQYLDVTIQIPVYKESMVEVLMPTLRSCIAARDFYIQQVNKHYNNYNTNIHNNTTNNNNNINNNKTSTNNFNNNNHNIQRTPSKDKSIDTTNSKNQSDQNASNRKNNNDNNLVRCNIVICDDGMMAYLRDNFAAAEMLWNTIVETRGQYVRLSQLLKRASRASRMHLKGLRSTHVYEVFHRMLYYYHYNIGFVARSTIDRRGKFKKASNLNSHLRLALGAMQRCHDDGENGISFEDALLEEVHNDDGSRYIMFGNDIRIGDLICVNDADARMAESIIYKTVPEFLNDKSLGFTQHATKTMIEQRNESYFTNMLSVYTDALYQGHFLLSSILGCHPPLVGHSVFLRTEALKQCGRVRTLRKAQQWLERIGLHFLPVDQVGFANLEAENRIEYWSEEHVSEDFELMIHLYSLGFNGRYCAYPDCEFQEGITRTFDEEAGRHRKFALGAHELVFNSFPDMLGRGVFTPVFKTFLSCDIPSYYKIFLTAYLCSYASGGTYVIVFTVSAIMRIFDRDGNVDGISVFNPAGVIILNFVIYYVVGYVTFIISMIRMQSINPKLLFKEYRKKWCNSCYLIFVMIRYCFTFQFLFYNVTAFTFYFLGSMDHLLGKQGIVGATNKDSITISRCTALYETIRFNSGSWTIAVLMAVLAYGTVVQEYDWDVTDYPNEKDEYIQHALFAGPAAFLAILAIAVPIILNPFVLGWPFLRRKKKVKKKKKEPPVRKRVILSSHPPKEVNQTVDITNLMTINQERSNMDEEIRRKTEDLDDEENSYTTCDLKTQAFPESPFYNRNGKLVSLLDSSLNTERNAANQGQQKHPSELTLKTFNAVEAIQNRANIVSSRSNAVSSSSSFERSKPSLASEQSNDVGPPPQTPPRTPERLSSRSRSKSQSPVRSVSVPRRGPLSPPSPRSPQTSVSSSGSPMMRRRQRSISKSPGRNKDIKNGLTSSYHNQQQHASFSIPTQQKQQLQRQRNHTDAYTSTSNSRRQIIDLRPQQQQHQQQQTANNHNGAGRNDWGFAHGGV